MTQKAQFPTFPASCESSSLFLVSSWCGHTCCVVSDPPRRNFISCRTCSIYKTKLIVSQSPSSVSILHPLLSHTTFPTAPCCHSPTYALVLRNPYISHFCSISQYFYDEYLPLGITWQVSLTTFPTIARDRELTMTFFFLHVSLRLFSKTDSS